MQALSLWQPYASLVVRGLKRCETRSWPTPHRGRLLIHAAKRWEADCAQLLDVEPFATALECAALPLGSVIGCVDVVDCLSVAQVCLPGDSYHDNHRLAISADEQAFGNYSAGRFVWVLANAREFRLPFAYRGGQQLFDIPQKEFPLGLFEGG